MLRRYRYEHICWEERGRSRADSSLKALGIKTTGWGGAWLVLRERETDMLKVQNTEFSHITRLAVVGFPENFYILRAHLIKSLHLPLHITTFLKWKYSWFLEQGTALTRIYKRKFQLRCFKMSKRLFPKLRIYIEIKQTKFFWVRIMCFDLPGLSLFQDATAHDFPNPMFSFSIS